MKTKTKRTWDEIINDIRALNENDTDDEDALENLIRELTGRSLRDWKYDFQDTRLLNKKEGAV